MENMTIEALEDMKQELMERGWVQQSFMDAGGRVCLMGAYTRTSLVKKNYNHGFVGLDDVMNALERVLAGTTCTSVLRFNDTPGRTFNEVIDLIDKAILEEKELSR